VPLSGGGKPRPYDEHAGDKPIVPVGATLAVARLAFDRLTGDAIPCTSPALLDMASPGPQMRIVRMRPLLHSPWATAILCHGIILGREGTGRERTRGRRLRVARRERKEGCFFPIQQLGWSRMEYSKRQWCRLYSQRMDFKLGGKK
jgi:hypothetical protein